MKIKNLIFIIFGILFLTASLSFIFAEVSYCCEKTTSGAWCQNAVESSCAVSDSANNTLRKAPTSCDATSFCKLGTCYDRTEGTCMENTPQRVCEQEGGIWREGSADDIPQCGLGCCLLGDQAAFVTQTRCSALSSLYALEINYRTDITSEIQCIRSATSDVKGACVSDDGFDRNCEMLTKNECYDQGGQDVATSSEISVNDSEDEVQGTVIEFYGGYLCTAPELDTLCGPSEQTTCVEGSDEVFFLDNCGNLANIYDASKQDDLEYWTQIKTKSESCGSLVNNAGSAECGNCDYFLGSACGEYKRLEDPSRPTYGDNICKDLSCEYQGQNYKHGESWCEATGNENNPGGRYFRLVCYNTEVLVEPCADFRQEICVEDSVGDYSTAACSVNKWQDCSVQDSQKDCENVDRRDCKWIEDANLSNVFDQEKQGGACVPNFSPGLNFWEADTDAVSICSQASKTCTITFESKEDFGDLLSGDDKDHKVKKNYECWGTDYYETGTVSEEWVSRMNDLCVNLGDCGVDKNFAGQQGFNELKDSVHVGENEEAAVAEPSSGTAGAGTAGNVGTAIEGVNSVVNTANTLGGNTDGDSNE